MGVKLVLNQSSTSACYKGSKLIKHDLRNSTKEIQTNFFQWKVDVVSNKLLFIIMPSSKPTTGGMKFCELCHKCAPAWHIHHQKLIYPFLPPFGKFSSKFTAIAHAVGSHLTHHCAAIRNIPEYRGIRKQNLQEVTQLCDPTFSSL